MKALHWIAVALAIIASFNWLLIGIAQFNAVETIMTSFFGPSEIWLRIVYVVFGLSAIYLLANFKKLG